MKVKTLTIKELRSKKPDEINNYISELKSSMSELMMAVSTNKENKTHQIGNIKKAIARAHTVSSESVKTEKEK